MREEGGQMLNEKASQNNSNGHSKIAISSLSSFHILEVNRQNIDHANGWILWDQDRA